MGIRKQLARGATYAKAPKITYSARHPAKAAAGRAASWARDHVPLRRRRRSRMRSTLTGIGAAAVAVPIGIWLGRKLWSGEEFPEQPGY